MSATPHPDLLQPLDFMLRGSRLIEASAGTGKTFTIAALYLRLVLGHGGDAAFLRPLTPPEILVVTFTDAATKELRDRIRARLAEAADAFLAQPGDVVPGAPGADLLHDLRASYPPGQWLACARTLRLAAEWMDESAVSTIHGWCKRMLSEHAFDSGSLFSQTLETDQRALLAEVTRDYWRSFFAPLPPAEAGMVRAWWATPDALLADVRSLYGVADALAPGQPPVAALDEAREVTARELAVLKQPWCGEGGWACELLTALEDAVAAKQCKLPKRRDWMQALRDWAEGDALLPAFTKTAWERLSRAGLAEGWTGDDRLLRHAAWDALEALRGLVAALPDGRQDILRHATHWTAGRLAVEQARRAQMGFDELLSRLDAALQGPNGERLAALIRRQFPVAMIDEFQDTDPLQYRIFDAIYGVAANAQDTALVLIGDPKQAIYAFRGADIHTYLAARSDTRGRHSTLGTNFRSTTAMVDAVNRVFLQAETREEGQGAFLFREGTDNRLPFFEVRAQGRKERWQVGGVDAPAFTFWTLAPDAGMTSVASGKAQERLAAACASEIVRLLTQGAAGTTGFRAVDGTLQPVQPGHIAVLVNSGREARAVRQALGQRGVRSVYLSDKDSVFQSAAAGDLQRWLAACADPDDDRPLRAALGSATFGLDWEALDRLNHDETLWEQRVMQFRRYQQVWRRQGVLPMLRRLMHDFSVPQRLLATGDERTLTDLLHLAELLQQAGAQLDGEHAQIRWLAEQRQDADAELDARKLRLESDADLVKVITVHKSKGLEYPLVFLPFATAFRERKAGDMPLTWHDEAGRAVVALQADDDGLARADRERLGEDLRKLYVALTRARHAIWVGCAPLKGVEGSALGYLLGGGRPLASQGLAEALVALAAEGRGGRGGGNGGDGGGGRPEHAQANLFDLRGPADSPRMPPHVPDMQVVAAPPADAARYRPVTSALDFAPDPPLAPGPRESWWVASYTALSRTGFADGPASDLQPFQVEGDGDGMGVLPPLTSPSTAAEDIYADSLADAPVAPATVGNTRIPSHPDSRPDNPVEPAPQVASMAGRIDDPAADAETASLHAFPRGAGPGTFLHGLLEWAGQQGFDRVHGDAAVQADLADLIARRCNLSGWSEWTQPLRTWLQGWVATPWRLDALAPDAASGPVVVTPSSLGRVQIEMEFWLAVQRVDTRVLDRLVTRHTLGGQSRPALLPQQANGMLKGFIDLVFEHGGRYYVADYKSNWLGAGDADYSAEALRGAVLQHRYELQYVLYIVALHRLLGVRLPDYDYDRHIGGAVYLFLRGHAAASQGLHAERPPRALVEALDALFRHEAPGTHDQNESA